VLQAYALELWFQGIGGGAVQNFQLLGQCLNLGVRIENCQLLKDPEDEKIIFILHFETQIEI